MLKTITSYPKKYILPVLILLIFLGGYLYFAKNDKNDFEYIVVKRGDLTQEVSVTGKVKPTSKVDLAFESTGRVSNIYVDIGDKVFAGQRLASLNSSQYQAQYSQAKANLEAEQSKLDELIRGTRFEELAVQKIKIQNAEQSLSDAKNNLVNKIKDAYTKSDDAIRNKSDQLFNNPRSTNPDLNFNTDFVVENEIEAGRLSIEELLKKWEKDLVNLNRGMDNLAEYYNSAKENLTKISYFLDKLSLAVNGMSASSSVSQATIDGYRAGIATARTNINTAISSLSSADEKLRGAEASLSLEKQTLVLEEAGATAEQIKIQEARIKSAQANVDNYKALIAKTIIYSPIKGVVTKVDTEKGEIIQLNKPVITIISEAEFEIEVNIPEADIAKVNIGDTARVTLDAYEDDDIFEAKVTSIEPAETVIEGVSTYKTTLQFKNKDNRIKSGMTANIDILTNKRKDVLTISFRAIKTEGGKHVEILKSDGAIEERPVETGMRSSDGRVEIISGLEEGDKVVTSK